MPVDEKAQKAYETLRELGEFKKDPAAAKAAAMLVKLGELRDVSGGTKYPTTNARTPQPASGGSIDYDPDAGTRGSAGLPSVSTIGPKPKPQSDFQRALGMGNPAGAATGAASGGAPPLSLENLRNASVAAGFPQGLKSTAQLFSRLALEPDALNAAALGPEGMAPASLKPAKTTPADIANLRRRQRSIEGAFAPWIRSGDDGMSAAARAGGEGALPSIGGFAGFARGAQFGRMAPGGPLVKGAASLLTGMAGAFGGSGLLSAADRAVRRYGAGDDLFDAYQAQLAREAKQFPVETALGSNFYSLLLGKPTADDLRALPGIVAAARGAGGGRAALAAVRASEAGQNFRTALGSRLMEGGVEVLAGAGESAVTGRPMDPRKVAIDAAVGALLPGENRAGRVVTNLGENLTERILLSRMAQTRIGRAPTPKPVARTPITLPPTAPMEQKKAAFNEVVRLSREMGDPHPEVAAAQWALESGWGASQSGQNNFFGIKARKGQPSTRKTQPFETTTGKPEAANFVDYATPEEGIQGRIQFLGAGRYRGYKSAKTPSEAISALVRGGYAGDTIPDPESGMTYSQQLGSILRTMGVDAAAPSTGGKSKGIARIPEGQQRVAFAGKAARDASKVNPALVDRLEAAAEAAGLKIAVTTAITGHSRMTTSGNVSRHGSGTGVDIASLDGVTYASDPKLFTEKAERLAKALEGMGASRNAESGRDFAVLFGFDDPKRGGNHLNHLHVSYRGSDRLDWQSATPASTVAPEPQAIGPTLTDAILGNVPTAQAPEPTVQGDTTTPEPVSPTLTDAILGQIPQQGAEQPDAISDEITRLSGELDGVPPVDGAVPEDAGALAGNAAAPALPAAAAPPTPAVSEAAPPAAPKVAGKPRITPRGTMGEAFTPDNEAIPFRYEVVEAGDLRTSHNPDALGNFAENPDYDQTLQPRDRSRVASREQAENLASNLIFSRVADAPTTADGAPIVGDDLQVESGNMRSMSIRKAYAEAKPSAAQYRADLAREAARFGLDPATIQGMKEPVLVRVRLGRLEGAERAALAERMGKATVASMSDTEKAVADSRRLLGDDAVLSKLASSNLRAMGNVEFTRAFAAMLDPSERAELYTPSGELSQTGERRIEKALLAAAYEDSALLERLFESPDDGVRSIGNALKEGAPDIARLKRDIRKGSAPALDLSEDLAAAVNQFTQVVRSAPEKMKASEAVKAWLANTAMDFEETGPGLSAMAEELLAYIGENSNRGAKLGFFLTSYVDAVKAAGDPANAKLLEGRAPTRSDILEVAKRRAEEKYEKTQTADLFAEPKPAAKPEPTKAAAPEPAAVSRTDRAEAADAGAPNAEVEPAGDLPAPVQAVIESLPIKPNPKYGARAFAQAYADWVAGGKQGKQPDFTDTLIREQTARNMRRRIDAAFKEADSQGERDATGSRADLEPGRQNGRTENRLGEGSLPAQPATDSGGGRGRGERLEGEGLRPGNDSSLPDAEAASAGERSDITPYSGESKPEPTASLTGDNLDQSGVSFSDRGVPAESVPDSVVEEAAGGSRQSARVEPRTTDRTRAARPAAPEPSLEEAIAAQAAAQDVPITLADRANIDESLPLLKPSQRDDVFKAETRFSQPTGFGMLFTNGTGTGKTYTGLGIAKRFERQGKTNILIIAPSEGILEQWQSAAQGFQLSIGLLSDTQSNGGSGIVGTTYANFGANRTLADRDWDLVIADEAHYLMMNEAGESTKALDALRAITRHPGGVQDRAAMLYRAEYDAMSEAAAAANAASRGEALPDAFQGKSPQELQGLRDQTWQTWLGKQEEARRAQSSLKPEERTRLVALSATPFAHEKDVDWAQGYLFDYPEVKRSGGYNQPGPRQQFMIENFGYRMRTGKLTEPEAAVNRSVMQRQFNARLKKEGSLSGRMIDVPFDYERKFALVSPGMGAKIDEGLELLRRDERFRPLWDIVYRKFDYLSRRRLMEAIKATEVIPLVQQELEMGRKVVIFHDYNEGGGANPFDLSEYLASDQPVSIGKGATERLGTIVSEFKRDYPDLWNLPIPRLRSAIETLRAAFPDALFYNGRVPAAKRSQAKQLFNDDASGRNIIVAQAKAAREGLSLHDTTGRMPRVSYNLGMPVEPTTAIQQEGRIYRVGQQSDAMFRYLSLGTNWEAMAYADLMAQRTGTAENLALGEEARALKDAFIDAYRDAEPHTPGYEGEGTGGKENDRAVENILSPFDRAKANYFAQQKRTSRNKSLEGIDYFPTPEPLGVKMLEWAGVKPNESVLEPSAGHGAIARYIPDDANGKAIEPSDELLARLKLALPANTDAIQGRFEDYNTINKHDVIVMNPPYGHGGATAIQHLAKASQHLKDGGRILAIIPTGPAADKAFDKWFYGTTKVNNPSLADSPAGKVYKGDIVRANTGAKVEVLKAASFPGQLAVRFVDHPRLAGQTTNLNPAAITEIVESKGASREVPNAPNLYLAADITLPRVAFERAGTSVATRIVVLDRVTSKTLAPRVQQVNRDFSDAKTINEFFDRIENSTIPERLPLEAPRGPQGMRPTDSEYLESPDLGKPERALPAIHREDLAAPIAPASARVKVSPLPNKGDSLTPPGELIKRLSLAVGRNVRVARQRRGVAGSYAPETARTTIRWYGDLETTAHEVGHALDDAYSLGAPWYMPRARSPYDSELFQPAFQATAKTSHTLRQRRSEAIAEWMRAYAMNPDEARRLAPTWTAFVEGALPKETLAAWRAFGDGARSIAGAPAMKQAELAIAFEEGDPRSVREKLTEQIKGDGYDFSLTWLDKTRSAVLDSMRPVEAATEFARKLTGATGILPEKDPLLLMRLHAGEVEKVNRFIESGIRTPRGEQIPDLGSGDPDAKLGGLDWLLEPLMGTSVAETEQNLRLAAVLGLAERTLEKSVQFGRDAHITGIGMGLFTDATTARAVMAELQQAPPDYLDRLQEGLRRYRAWANALLDYSVEAGRMSQEDADTIKRENAHYIALQRMLEDQPAFVGTGNARRLGSVITTVQKMKGSDRRILNPFISLLDQTYKTVSEADRNAAVDAFFEPFRTDRTMHSGSALALERVASRVQAKSGPLSDERKIRVFHNGVEEVWDVHPDVFAALKGLGEPGSPKGLMRVVSLLTARLPRTLITQNPAFATRNFLRDSIERSLKSAVGSTPLDSFKAFSREDRDAFYRAGGGNAGHYLASRKSYQKALKQAVGEMSGNSIVLLPQRGFNAYNRLLSLSEEQGRMAEYTRAFKEGKKRGYDDYNASLFAAGQARGLMDFAVAGTLLRSVQPYIPFLNAAIQGNAATWRAAGKNPGVFLYRFGMLAGASLIPLLLAMARGQDDLEEYRNLPAYQRDLFFNFKLGPDMWLRIPKGFEVAVLASGIERAIDRMQGNDRAFAGYFEAPGRQSENTGMRFLSGTLAQNLIPVRLETLLGLDGVPGALREIKSNYDDFRQRSIVPQSEVHLPIAERKGAARASWIGKLLSKAIASDPRAIDHFLNSIGGSTTQTALALSDLGREDKALTPARAWNMGFGVTTGSPGFGSPVVEDAQAQIERAGFRPHGGPTKKPNPADIFQAGMESLRAAKTPLERDRGARELRNASTRVLGNQEPFQRRQLQKDLGTELSRIRLARAAQNAPMTPEREKKIVDATKRDISELVNPRKGEEPSLEGLARKLAALQKR